MRAPQPRDQQAVGRHGEVAARRFSGAPPDVSAALEN
jgi:hypothetical protein